jgi:alpha-tubulin suppressor-like RCC1 family protein
MRVLHAIVFACATTTAACNLVLGVDWERVATSNVGAGHEGGASNGSGSNGTTSTSECPSTQVECFSTSGETTCCANSDDMGSPRSLAAGKSNTCAVTTTGRVRCWGSNANGQLGRGDDVALRTSNKPLTVLRILHGAKKVAVGGAHVCAIVDSMLTCWGDNSSGQFGNGSVESARLPTAVTLPGVAQNIAAGHQTTCASIQGAGYCWGSNKAQQAGGGDTEVRLLVPNAVRGIAGVRMLVPSEAHACAATASGLFCWGNNTANRLGKVGETQTGTAVAVTNGSGSAAALALGTSHACAVIGGGLRCWGSNYFGEMGDDAIFGQTTGAVIPVGMSTGVTSTCAGASHSCALQNGSVKCWGANDQGQTGTAASVRIPSPVEGLTSGVKEIVCGANHTCALRESGDIQCWGANDQGQLGDGTTDAKASKPRTVIWP